MAGKRKAEGIALLSVYAGSDDDDDAASESSDEEEENQRENEQEVGAPLAADVTSGDVVGAVSAPRAGVRVAASGLGIVDYAHDEAAASPEPGEVCNVVRCSFSFATTEVLRVFISLQVQILCNTTPLLLWCPAFFTKLYVLYRGTKIMVQVHVHTS